MRTNGDVTCVSWGRACALGLLVLALVGCGETGAPGGAGGTGGSGGSAGTGGGGGSAGMGGSGVVCEGNVCACTEAGIRAAIAQGGGPYTFDCDGPTTVVTDAEIFIDNDVILDGEGNLTVDGDDDHRVFWVPEGAAAELRGLEATNGAAEDEGGGIINFGTVTLTNSTVSGNTTADFLGEGIYNSGTVTLTNSTVSGNSGSQGSLYNYNATLMLTNSIVDGDCLSSQSTLASNGYNIESPGDTCGFDQVTDQVSVSDVDLKLAALADNGGPTRTHALLPGSVAIDKIPATDCEVTTDQRGVSRPQGPACDVGAFELEVAP